MAIIHGCILMGAVMKASGRCGLAAMQGCGYPSWDEDRAEVGVLDISDLVLCWKMGVL